MESCGKCNSSISVKELVRSIPCSGTCSNKFHISCVNLSENQLTLILSCDNIQWLCDTCGKRSLSTQNLANGTDTLDVARMLKKFEFQESILCDIQIRLNRLENIRLASNVIGKQSKDINSSPAPSSRGPYAKLWRHKKFIIPGILAVLTLMVIAIVLGIDASSETKSKNVLLGNSEESRKNIPINSTIAQDNVGSGYVLRIVPRDGWLAQPPVNPWVKLNLPVNRVIIIPTRTSNCETQAACTYTVRFTQTFNIESQRQDDIIYNFMIGGDGNVYEGRGWNNRGSAVIGFNDDSISLAFIGSFNKKNPSDKQMNVTQLLLNEGVRLGKLSKDYRIVAANKLDPASTATSADALYKSFENWPHWSDH